MRSLPPIDEKRDDTARNRQRGLWRRETPRKHESVWPPPAPGCRIAKRNPLPRGVAGLPIHIRGPGGPRDQTRLLEVVDPKRSGRRWIRLIGIRSDDFQIPARTQAHEGIARTPP